MRDIKTEEFVEKSRDIHGNTYDYSNVIYSRSNKSIGIICPDHGIFEQSPNSHLNGRGCSKCGRIEIETIIKKELKFSIDIEGFLL